MTIPKSLWIFLGTRLSDRISNSRRYKKCGSVLLSKAIMRERLWWQGQVPWMKDNILPQIVLFGEPSRAKRKAGRPRFGRKDSTKSDLKEMGTLSRV